MLPKRPHISQPEMRVYYVKGKRELNCGSKYDVPWIEFVYTILKVLSFPYSVLPHVSLQNSFLFFPKNFLSKNHMKTFAVNMFFRMVDIGQRWQEVRTFKHIADG